jgi:hypothetical protein
MAPATAATPDPTDPPMQTITNKDWAVLLRRADRANPHASSWTDPEAVADRLVNRHRRSQAGNN